MAEDEAKQTKASKGSAMKIIVIVLISLLLVGGTVGGLYFAGVFGGHETDGEEEAAQEEVGEAIYIPVDPAFVVNFAQGEKARFLQVTLELMTRSVDVETKIQKHMPVIRNNLLLLFSGQTYDSVNTIEGKEALRQQALLSVQQILEEETGDPGVEAVYFTSFVMQ
jgi:flagellar FliL protein